MRLLMVGVLLIAAAPDREDPSPKPKTKSVHEQLVGDWRLMNLVVGGRAEQKEGGTILTITPTEIQVTERGQRNPQDDASYHLDTQKNPVQIDIVPKRDGDMKVQGIVKVEGDTLTLCFPFGGEGMRPAEFLSPQGTQTALMVFQRLKK